MLKIEPLIEQTAFLLEKQKEMQRDCSQIFKDFLETIDLKIKATKLAEDARHLEKIYSIVTTQAEGFEKEAQEDIAFLTEQHKMLTQIQAMGDKEKAAEVLRMAVEDMEEIEDTEEFKKNVDEDLQVSKRNLLVMIDDLKAALAEGSAEEVAGVLDAWLAEQDACGCGDDCTCDDSCGEDDQKEFNSCCGCKSKECCSDEDANACRDCCSEKTKIDVFSKFNELADKKR